MFIRRGSAPRSNPLPIYVPFFTEKVPLSYTFFWQMVRLTHTSFRTLYPFNCCNCKVTKLFLNFLKPQINLLALLGPFTDPNDISLPFCILQLVKPLPFDKPEAWKKYPFRAQPPCIGHHREFPPLPPGKLTQLLIELIIKAMSHRKMGISQLLKVAPIQSRHTVSPLRWPFFW